MSEPARRPAAGDRSQPRHRRPAGTVLCLAAEAQPWAKAGGLADVVTSLSARLASTGWNVRICLPAYRWVLDRLTELETVATGQRAQVGDGYEYSVLRVAGPERPAIFFVRCDPLYDRGGIYGEDGSDYPDNLLRFGLLCEAGLSLPRLLGERVDIVHTHDWHTALAAVWLSTKLSDDPFVGGARTVFTIHNLAHQGIFDPRALETLGLPGALLTPEFLEFNGMVNLMKGGIVFSDQITTVSPRYAEEIQTLEFGAGLDGVLRKRHDALSGILNGIDPTLWDPASDPWIAANYDARTPEEKRHAKRALQETFGLATLASVPVVGYIGRMVTQKGIDLVIDSLETILEHDLQLIMLGTGDPRLEQSLTEAAARYPDKLGVEIGFDERLAHQIEAGCDLFLMPSRFEPCGLNQLYSMRYGTIPIVHDIGGLSDTVTDATPRNLRSGRATGVVFKPHTREALLQGISRALALYKDPPTWKALQKNAMAQDWSWERSGRAYDRLYRRAIKAPPRRLSLPDLRDAARPQAGSWPYVDWGPELPPDYGKDTLVLLMQAPQKLFCYWEVTPGTRRRATEEAGLPETTPLALVLRRLDRDERWIVTRQVGHVGDWWLDAYWPGALVVAEIVLPLKDGGSRPLLRSNPRRVPHTGLSWRTDVTWARREKPRPPSRPAVKPAAPEAESRGVVAPEAAAAGVTGSETRHVDPARVRYLPREMPSSFELHRLLRGLPGSLR